MALGVEAPKDIEVPLDLVTEEAILRKMAETKPTWVSVSLDPTRQDSLEELQTQIKVEKDQALNIEATTTEDEEMEEDNEKSNGNDGNGQATVMHGTRRKRQKAVPIPRVIHKPTGIILLQLSNGIRVNYMYSSYYQKRCAMRVTR